MIAAIPAVGVSMGPHGVAVTPDCRKVYVTNINSGSVSANLIYRKPYATLN